MTRVLALALLLGMVMAAPALAQSTACAPLLSRLDSFDLEGSSGGNGALADLIARQRYEIDNTAEYSRSIGCDVDPSAQQCRALNTNLRRMERNLASLERQDRLKPGGGAERKRIEARLAALNCPGFSRESRERPLVAGNFEDLFGDEANDPAYALPPSTRAPEAAPRLMTNEEAGDLAPAATMRTICVRKCDGSFFPISFATSSRQFEADAATCTKMCPAAQVELFAYDTFAEKPDDAVSAISGEPLNAMTNAFRFRTEIVPDCSCRRPGQSWSEALAPLEAELKRRKSDIVVSDATPVPENAKRKSAGSEPEADPVIRGTLDALPSAGNTVRQVGPAFEPTAPRQ